MDNEIIKYIKKITTGFFKEWPLKPKIDVSAEDEFVTIDIKTEKDEIFITPSIDPLLAIQHLIRLMVRKQFPGQVVRVAVDIGGLRQRRKDAVKKITLEAVTKAVDSSVEINLLPMSSFERRLVHTCVAEDGRATSESVGVGRDRYVAIKPNA